MPLVLYFENGAASVTIDLCFCVHLTYHPGKHPAEDYLEVLQHTGHLLQRRQWHRLLEDQRQLMPLFAEQQLIMVDYWQKQARHLGYVLCVAVVQSESIFTRLTTTFLCDSLQAAPINYSLFTDTKAASAWLQIQASRSRFAL